MKRSVPGQPAPLESRITVTVPCEATPSVVLLPLKPHHAIEGVLREKFVTVSSQRAQARGSGLAAGGVAVGWPQLD